MTAALSARERRIVLVIWGTYAAYYLGRLNLSPALSALAHDLDASRAQVGLIGSVSFWLYALGQLVFGELGNHLRPHLIVSAGLAVIALTNVLFSLQSSLAVLIVLWGLNGFVQASGWGPMVRVLAERLEPAQRRRLSAVFPMSFQVGIAVTWALAGALVAAGGWRAAFWLPGLLTLGVLAVWWRAGVDAPPRAPDREGFRWQAVRTDWDALWPVLAAAAFVGFVNVGGVIWLPTYMGDTDLFPEVWVGALIGLLALGGVAGMAAAAWMLRQAFPVLWTTGVMLGGLIASALAAAWLPLPVQLAPVALLIVCASGVTALLISSIPLSFGLEGRASSSTGMITAMFNAGGGVAGVVIGALLERFTWGAVFGAWALSAGLALLLVGYFAWHVRPG